MIAIRRGARREPPMSPIPRKDFIKQLATELAGKTLRRVSPNIRTHLSGHLRAAVRRGILQSYRGALISVTRRRTTYDRTDLMRTIARHLGFGKLTASIRTRLKSTLNSSIRRDIIERVSKDEVRRV